MSHRNPQLSPAGRQKLMPPSLSRPGDSSPMLDKDKKKDSRDRQDEARLLGARYHDSQAVKIKPGATFLSKNKKPGSNFAFSPRDKLSQHARSSGPVRANGESNRQSPLMRRKSPQLGHAFEESDRPIKKRRQSETSETIDLTAPVYPAMNGSEQGSPQAPAIRKGNRRNRRPELKDPESGGKAAQGSLRPQLDQFFSGDSRDEQFTENAAQQRRTANAAKFVDPRLYRANRNPTQTVESVIPDRDEIGKRKVSRNRTALPSDQLPRPLNGRESPDELQGDITTHPLPKSLHEKQPRTTRQPQPQTSVETPTRKRSPADIRPTDFSSPSQGAKKAKLAGKTPEKQWLSCRFRIGAFNKTCQMREFAPIYSTKKGLELREDVLGDGNQISILFHQFRQIYMGQAPSRKLRIQLLKGSVEAGDQLDIEFWRTDEKISFQRVLGQANVATISKDMKWMDQAFAKYASQFLHDSEVPHKRPLDEQVEDSDPLDAHPAPRRPRLSDSLRDGYGELGNDHSPETKRPTQNKKKLANDNVETRKSAKYQKDHPTHSDTDTGADIPVEALDSTGNPPERETRSSTRRSTRNTEPSNGALALKENTKPRFEDDSFRKNWKQPLVYPPNGKKKAEVNLGDRDRLRTDDFLNDNLIAFYMRFLQDHLERTNPEAAKRIYFFNTYFFATLSKDSRTRGINYAGVEKWTRNVDLFSYDYIVVPINENAHWYVAIICNLPSLALDSADRIESVQTPTLEKEISSVSENEIHQIQETPEPELRPESEDASEESAEKSDDELTGFQRESESMKDLGPTEIGVSGDGAQGFAFAKSTASSGNPPPPANLSKFAAQKLAQEHAAASQSKGKFSKKKRAGLKLDPNQPTIVTFDSLDAPRSPTIRLLRDYTCKEAASKRGVQLDPTEIKGMRARDIPLQPNYWDCGLYLLTYLEKFVQHPDYFMAKVLQRNMRIDEDWPPLGAGLLRDRFGKFLDELYMEQKNASGPILVDKSPVSFLLGPPLPCQEEIPGVDVVPESQPDTNPSNSDHATSAKPKAKNQREDSTADQMHLVPTEQPQCPDKKATNPSADTPLQRDPVHQLEEGPIIQVPGTPPPTRKERKQKALRKGLRKE
ncbi:Peptidase C48 SUMO/Sentrin/Ubl1 [Penicillium paradoxum]|uniref:Peptidase C48 SUMO/Sentrin/Ubl1 n=1 Tax=Penicillium paradoxum TaxID=176176 RepID=UPI0025478E63|nr:Peptidase C48 SUMO/Sentrin/Ubl1 [Penicillium paradoxum]KAJ5795194.1 Peptidase C48 SUMO/Sentrin/Ubl1 [Penicillium paradoxum]